MRYTPKQKPVENDRRTRNLFLLFPWPCTLCGDKVYFERMRIDQVLTRVRMFGCPSAPAPKGATTLEWIDGESVCKKCQK